MNARYVIPAILAATVAFMSHSVPAEPNRATFPENFDSTATTVVVLVAN